ncbi:hypothetical protein FACS1894211_15340 [Clostridia bacterium]|nr:hypothetical protein FACS1894211_15340 [Clostridia bacterium]
MYIKMTRKLFKLLLPAASLLAVFIAAAFASTPRNAKADTAKPVLIFLGDSITAGYGTTDSASGKPDYATAADPNKTTTVAAPHGYAELTAAAGGYALKNYAVDGWQTTHVLGLLNGEGAVNDAVRADIASAAVIHFSIGGNDMQGQGSVTAEVIVELLTQAYNPSSPTPKADAMRQSMYANFTAIYERLRGINPGADIIALRNYAPLYSVAGNNALGGNFGSVTGNQLYSVAKPFIESFNVMVDGYIAGHPGSFTFMNISAVWDENEVYFNSSDLTHPSDAGHAALALLLQKTILKNENAALESGNARLTGEKQTFSDENEALKADKSRLTGENQTLSDENEVLKADKSRLTEENKSLKDGGGNNNGGLIAAVVVLGALFAVSAVGAAVFFIKGKKA